MTIQTYQKSKKNKKKQKQKKNKKKPEMSSVTSNYLENMCHNSFYDKWCLRYGLDLFSNMADGGHPGFKIQLVFLEIPFSMILWSFHTKMGHLHHDLKWKVTKHLY